MVKKRVDMKLTELLNEGYQDRVEDTAQKVLSMLNGVGTLASIKKAIHVIASPSDAASEHNSWAVYGHSGAEMMPNGIPDYNGPAATRNEFIKDVAALVLPHIKRPATGAASPEAHQSRISLADIWEKAQDSTSALPDGDPSDSMSSWLRRNSLTWDDVDRAAKKFTKKSYHDYVADVWDDLAGDALYDARNGHYGEDYSDQWFARGNPWR